MAVIVETWMAEDLEYGVEATTKTHPSGGTLNGTQISISSLSTCGPAGYAPAKLWTPGTVAAGAQVTEMLDAPGAAVGDKVLAALDSLVDPLILVGCVLAPNEVTVILANLTGASVTVSEGTLSAVVLHHRIATP